MKVSVHVLQQPRLAASLHDRQPFLPTRGSCIGVKRVFFSEFHRPLELVPIATGALSGLMLRYFFCLDVPGSFLVERREEQNTGSYPFCRELVMEIWRLSPCSVSGSPCVTTQLL